MAYPVACEASEANMSFMISEGGRTFSPQLAREWLEKHGEGYFIRDENDKAFDCQLMTKTMFDATYFFAKGDEGMAFRRIIRR